MTTRATLPLACALAALALVARPALGDECVKPIDEAMTQALFDQLAKAAPADGCVLESVDKDTDALRVRWKKNGEVGEAIVVPERCALHANQSLGTVVPPSVAAACPAAAEITLRRVGEALTPGALPQTNRRSIPRLAAELAGAAALADQLLRLFLRKRAARAAARPGPASPA